MRGVKNKRLIIFMPFIGIGGVEKNLYIISNFLSKKIKNLSICTISKDKKKNFNKNINFITPNFNVPEKLNIRLKYLICIFILLKNIIRDKNCLLLSFQANIYCILICKLFNIKVLIRSNSSPSGWYHNIFKKKIYQKIVSLADEVIVNSLEFKKEMEKKFKIKAKCIYNPLNVVTIKKKSQNKIRNNFFKKNYLNIINVGRLTEQKNQILILKAINSVKKEIKVKLLVIGRGIEYQKLNNYILDNNLSKIVKIQKPDTNPYKFMNKSDLFILSSNYEGLPNVLLEAAVLKKFIISSDCPTGPKEILKNGRYGYLFKVGDHNQLKKKILLFSKNRKNLKKKSENLNKSLNRFDEKNNLNFYLNLINKYI